MSLRSSSLYIEAVNSRTSTAGDCRKYDTAPRE
jgi:hypothetical protein